MNYPWLDSYCADKAAVVREFKVEWQAIRFLIDGKIYAMIGQNAQAEDILSLKLPPDEGIILREMFKDVIPGYHLNKVHWNSVRLAGEVPDAILKKMIDTSYRLIVEALPKKRQNEIKAMAEQSK